MSAWLTRAMLVLTPRSFMIEWRWVSTVRTEMASVWAISRERWPSAIILRMRDCCGVRRGTGAWPSTWSHSGRLTQLRPARTSSSAWIRFSPLSPLST
ncbi:hypothetical protein CSC65_14285 [Pseudoxanthomonas daejeonensis]|uniref:Secreted protein n=1 Tax=Pseudoxanthomonas daejeonensis TaxID=266062 RepID=A0ABQ6Z4C4_9GAMM|nr:hypothetical protein CSC65_14285 [Pseudoxanthomonas daejeonensis]